MSRQIFEEFDDAFFVDLMRSKDGQYIHICVNSKTSSEVWLLNNHVENAEPVLLKKRQANVAYFPEHAGDSFFIVTNSEQVRAS